MPWRRRSAPSSRPAGGSGFSISLDELTIGFSIGLSHLPVTAIIIAIAVQAFIAAQLGLAIGSRIGERWRERAGQPPGSRSSCWAATSSPTS